MRKFFLLCFLIVWGSRLYPLNFTHEKIDDFELGAELVFQMEVDQRVSIALLFYQVGDSDYFQVRKMEKDPENRYTYRLDSGQFTGRILRYHFVTRSGKAYTRFPAEEEIVVRGSGEPVTLPPPREIQEPFPFKFNGNMEGKWAIESKEELSGSDKSFSNGNVSINGNISREGYSMAFTSTSNYLPNQPDRGNLDVSSVAMVLRTGKHSLQLGNVSFAPPDLVLSPTGKRGFLYRFQSERIHVRAFTLSSQRIAGFGLPERNSTLAGGMLDLSLGPVRLLTLVMSGKDDPTLGLNSYYTFDAIRQGSVYGFGLDIQLLKSAVNLHGMYYLSNYSSDSENQEKIKDHAISSTLSINHKNLSLTSQFQDIGGEYNSVGTQYLANNQRGIQSSLNYTLLNSKVALTLNHSYLTTNLEETISGSPQSSTHNISPNINLMLGKFMVGTGYQSNQQSTDIQENLGIAPRIQSSQFLLNLGYSTTPFTLMLSGGRSLNKSITEQSSYTFNGSFTVNLSDHFILSPSGTYLWVDDNGEVTRTITSYITYKIVLFPKVLSISGTGSYTSAKTPGGLYDMSNLNLASRLSLHLGWLWEKLASSSLFIEGQYLENAFAGETNRDYRIYGNMMVTIY